MGMGRIGQVSDRLGGVTARLPSASQSVDGRRIKTQPGAHLYKDARWSPLRLVVLRRDKWTCRMCGVALIGRHPAADSPVVDHVVPHLGDEVLFFDAANLQAVCKACHDGPKQRADRARLR